MPHPPSPGWIACSAGNSTEPVAEYDRLATVWLPVGALTPIASPMLPRACVRGVRIHASPVRVTSPIPAAVCSWRALSGQIRENDAVDTGRLSLTRKRSSIEYATSATSVWTLNSGDCPPGASDDLSSDPTNHSSEVRRRYASVSCHSRPRWYAWPPPARFTGVLNRIG